MPKIERKMYGQYELRWTGWKGAPNDFCIRGQWVAICKGDHKNVYYADTSGVTGLCQMGDQMFSSSQPLNIFSPLNERERVKKLALALLIEFLDAKDMPARASAHTEE